MKLFHLNIWEGAYIDKVIEYVNAQDFDVLQFQEVNGGRLSRGGYYKNPYTIGSNDNQENPKNAGIDCFLTLQDQLLGYTAFQSKSWNYSNEPGSYCGNATFIKKTISVHDQKVIHLNTPRELTDDSYLPIENHPHTALAILAEDNRKKFWLVNTHFAWGPTPKDADHKMKEAIKLYTLLKGFTYPFILSGDFNMTPDTNVVQMISTLATNLTIKNNISNTLNPRLHKAQQLFPPGFAVDYIFVHNDIPVRDFSLIEDDLSDHFGLQATLEVPHQSAAT